MSDLIWNGKRILTPNGGLHIIYNQPTPLPKAFIYEATASNTLTLPLWDTKTYNFDLTVDWGDGSPVEHYMNSDLTTPEHTYSTPGTKQVTIEGLCEKLDFTQDERLNLTKILQWGDLGYKSFEQSFRGCHNLTTANGGTENVMNSVTNMSGMFASESEGDVMILTSVSLPQSIPNVTDMSYMFRGCANISGSSITLPNSLPSLTVINNMFRSAGLGNFTLPNSFANTTTFYHTFRYSNLESITFPTTMDNISVVSEMFEFTPLINVTLPMSMSGLSNISYWFDNCTQLETIIFPKTLNVPLTNTSLLFSNCPALELVDLSNSNLGGTDIDAIFTVLPTVSYTAEIDISQATGWEDCDQSIATNKGWTVTT